MFERLLFLGYAIGWVTSGGFLSALLIERQKRANARRRTHDYYRRSPEIQESDKVVDEEERILSMTAGFAAAIVWPALAVGTAVGAMIFFVGRGFGKIVLLPVVNKFEAVVSAPKTEKPTLGKLEKI